MTAYGRTAALADRPLAAVETLPTYDCCAAIAPGHFCKSNTGFSKIAVIPNTVAVDPQRLLSGEYGQ